MQYRTSQRPRGTDRRGFTIIELMMVFTIAALLVAIGVPRFNYLRQSSNVRSAKSQIGAALATARATAVHRSLATEVRVAANRLWVVTGPTLADTVVKPIMLDSTYRVALSTAPAVVRFDPRGLAVLDSTVKFVFVRDVTFKDSVCVTRVGAVMPEGCLR